MAAALLACAALTGSAARTAAAPNEVVVHPKPLAGPLRNPLMGFRPGLPGFQKEPDIDPYATVVRQYIQWNEIENREGDGIEKIRAYCESAWKGLPERGVKVVPRVYLRYTRDEESSWPADMTTGDYSSEQFKQRALRLISRLGILWDRDPRVAWVQMGLVGRWGEQHTPRPTPEQRVWLTEAFKTAFPHKQVLIRFPEDWKDSGFGVYWDAFGGSSERYNVNTFIDRNAVREGEVAYDIARSDPFGTKPDETLTEPTYRASLIDRIRQTRTAALGWVSDYDRKDPAARAGAATVQAHFGYRFALDEVRYPSSLERGAPLPVAFTVRNQGAAPFPYRWPVEVSLLDPASRKPVWRETIPGVDIRTWQPGEEWDAEKDEYRIPAAAATVSYTFSLPASIRPGRYALALAILDPAGNVPAVRFATAQYWKGGRSPVGYVGIGAPGGAAGIDPATFSDPNADRLGYTVGSGGPIAFGTLQTDDRHAAQERAGGTRLAMMEIFWDRYEKARGEFDVAYAEEQKRRLRRFRDAGFQVTLALGAHYPPRWLKEDPDGKFIDQNGTASRDVNFVFSEKNRGYLQRYLERIDADLGLENFWAIRLTSGGNAELLYPDGGNYWAFDPSAQNGPGRPTDLPPCPFPGWKPGQDGLTSAQVRQWADWYVRCLSLTADWQMRVMDKLGFTGWYQILTPGSGMRPSGYEDAIAKRLPNGLIGVGAVWHKVYEFLPNKRRAVVYVSSVADRSGSDNVTMPEDFAVPLADPAANRWSATRWQVRIAHEYGMPIGGENTGYNMPASINPYYVDRTTTGVMARALAQAQAGGFQYFYWAHSGRLWDGTLPFTDFAAAISAVNGGKDARAPDPERR